MSEQELENKAEEQEVIDVDPLEEAARAKGWVPQEEWEGNPEDWRTAKEFIDRSSFFDKINSQNKQIRELQKTIKQFAEHHEKYKQQEADRLVAALKAQKVEALEAQDYATVADIDEKIAEAKEEARKPAASSTQAIESEDFVSFRDQNSWYGSDEEMTEEADALGMAYAIKLQNNGKVPTDAIVLDYVHKQIRKLYPEKFNTRPQGGSPVTQASQTTGKGVQVKSKAGKASASDLTSDQRRIGETFVERGIIKSLDDYAVELQQMGEIVR